MFANNTKNVSYFLQIAKMISPPMKTIIKVSVALQLMLVQPIINLVCIHTYAKYCLNTT